MTEAQAELDDSGLSLWLTDRKDYDGLWNGRSLLALVGGRIAAYLDFAVHPDGHAISVDYIMTMLGIERRGYASVLADAMYAAYPNAWINWGGRTAKGCRWWDRYAEPDPERNIHNRPPSEWAEYFDAAIVGAQKARNAYANDSYGLDGHRHAEYPLSETEAERWVPALRSARVQGLNPADQDLYAVKRLVLRPGMHRRALARSVDVTDRAYDLLDHIGHGNLPHSSPGFWNATAQAAFDDAVLDELWQDEPSVRPSLQVVFRILALPHNTQVSHQARAGFVAFTGDADIPVQVTGMSWRTSDRPLELHTATLTPPVDAHIAPMLPQDTTPDYRARYDVTGHLRPYRDTRIADLADKIIRDSAVRTSAAPRPRDPPSGHTPGAPQTAAYRPPAGSPPRAEPPGTPSPRR